MLDIFGEKMRGKIEGIIDFSSLSKIVTEKIILKMSVDSKKGKCE